MIPENVERYARSQETEREAIAAVYQSRIEAPQTLQPQFQVGDKVKAVAFVECSGRQIEETCALVVTEVHRIDGQYVSKPYYRVKATQIDGHGYVEGAERFFALEAYSNSIELEKKQ